MRTRELPIRSIDLTKDVMPLSEFRSTIADCFARTRRTHRPILVTQNGRSASVVIDVADFQRMRETIELIDDVRAAEEEIEHGETISQAEFKRKLIAERRLQSTQKKNG